MAAKQKPVEPRSLANLDMDPSTVGLASATCQVLDFACRPRPQRAALRQSEMRRKAGSTCRG